jgi:CRP/FNR family transcriptional regulator, polysaccharide utilization system transcription regulator
MKNAHQSLCPDCDKCAARQVSVFNALTGDEVEKLQNTKCYLNFRTGQLIFKEGMFPSGIYIITNGKVKVTKNGFEGREQIMRFGRSGDILGYRALISKEKYTSSASTISDSNICFLSNDFIFSLIESNHQLGIRFMQLLAEDLRNTEMKAINLAQKNVRERIAEAILILKEVYGFEEDNATINVHLRRDEIAGLAGTVRETAIRYLSEFNDSGIIELSGKKIKIIDMRKLIHTANLFD